MEKQRQQARFRIAIDRERLRRDLLAALTVAAVAVPQDMAYAQIAGLPPQYGLYTGFVVTALAALFGSSAHLISGPTNAVSLVVFSALAALNFGSDRANPGLEMMQAVWLLAFLVGAIQLLIALLKLGDLTRYVSESVLLGFMAGAGVLIALGQVPNLLGIKPLGDGHLTVLQRLWLTLREGGGIDRPSALLGLGTLVLLMPLRMLKQRLKTPFPDLLLALILATAAAPLLDWQPRGGALDVERGLPAPVLPPLNRLDWVRPLGGSAVAISVLGLLEAVAVAKSIAARTRQRLDFNRECLAQGLANLGGSFFQCMPGSGSLTRSNINYQAGAVSRWSGVMSSLVVAASLLLLAPLARYVPKPALAALLIVTGYRLVDRSRLLYCLRATRYDAIIALSTALAAMFISVELSILIGVCVSFLLFVPRAARLQVTEMVVGPERVVRERQPKDPDCGRLAIFSLEGELFFGAGPLLEECLDMLRQRVKQGSRVLILRLKRTRNPDMVCLELLQQFLEEMQDRKVPVLLCGIRPDFEQALHNLRFHHWLPQDSVFREDVTMGSSTLKAVRRAYELLGDDLCATCPRREERDKDNWSYMI
ncbi:MAG TPA: SulP family inorganic anion transporter [Gemmataceae bacterium]|nr:SulP family inorganic anion transporter [Gemmataceae bacterium]